MASRRTTHRSSAGKKLYAVRDTEGQFQDIQTYERAHAQDLRQQTEAESATAAKTGKKMKKKAKKKAGKKKAGKKRAKKA
jgi:hypothetical protein